MNNIHLHKFNSKYNGFHDNVISKLCGDAGNKISSRGLAVISNSRCGVR